MARAREDSALEVRQNHGREPALVAALTLVVRSPGTRPLRSAGPIVHSVNVVLAPAGVLPHPTLPRALPYVRGPPATFRLPCPTSVCCTA